MVAQQLASFRLGDSADPFDFNEHEKLCAGHIVGALWAADLLNTGNEKWETVARRPSDDQSCTGNE